MRIEERPVSDEEKAAIKSGFEALNDKAGTPPHHTESISYVAVNEHGAVAGAVYGYIRWDWVYIDILYVSDGYRDQGLGTQLMNKVEDMARTRGMTGLHLTTHDWQGSKFYEKLGYTLYGTLDNFPKGHKRLAYCKYL
mgnify:CR=1 FL=1